MDLDGTLEDSRSDMVAAANQVRMNFGLEPRPFSALEPHVMKGMEHLYRNCFDELVTAGTRTESELLSALQTQYEQQYGLHIAEKTRAYPGIPEALEALCALGQIVVYTNKPEGLSRKLLGALDLSRCVTQVIGCDTYAESKPALAPMAAAAARAGFDPTRDRSCFVGDSQGDMQAALAFGAHGIWCAWGYHLAPPAGPVPGSTAGHPRELIAIVKAAFFVQ